MRLSISNIAWDAEEDADVAELLARMAVDAVDVAPGKYFPDPRQATDAQVEAVRQRWAACGIELTGMQALLFGTTGLNVFGTAEVQNVMLAHLEAVCRIGGGLGAKHLVFGSPKNRDRAAVDDEDVMDVACAFFSRLGDVAARHGVWVCLEPNPAAYGANFMTTSADTAAVVRTVGHPAIRMQLDIGAVTMNGEDVAQVVAAHGDLIAHVHASEPGLKTLGDGGSDHARAASVLAGALPRHVVCIEMLASNEEPHLAAIERAVRAADAAYRATERGA
ncbi:MAG: hypothetical protein AzoDbin1_05191 [Azoarcus sp.]|nr:hypothetical protein [Azoarcus sp.]